MLTIAQAAARDSPEKYECFGCAMLHRLYCKHRTSLLGQISSVMKFVWLLLVYKLHVLRHPTDRSICAGKNTSLALVTNWHVLFPHSRLVPGGLRVEPAPLNLFNPCFFLWNRALHCQGSLETACPLSGWWFLFRKG